MSDFESTTIGVGASWEFGRAWQRIERGSLGVNLDYIQFDYNNFRDLTQDGPVGQEPLYEFDATVIRALATIWFYVAASERTNTATFYLTLHLSLYR